MSSQPPNQFSIETESKTPSNHNYQKCRLCRVDRRRFICKNCLVNGNWISSRQEIGYQAER